MKKILIAFSLFILFCLTAIAENEYYEFGPKSENLIIFTASKNAENTSTKTTEALKKLAAELKTIKLKQRVIIAITDNDVLNLPNFVPNNDYRNTKEVINKTHDYKYIAAYILEDGNSNSVKISAGANQKTSPAWMLKDLYEALKKEGAKIDFKSSSIILCRLGLSSKEPVFAKFLNEEIPTIKISSNKNINPVLKSLIAKYEEGVPRIWDKHYIVKNIFYFNIISEKLIIFLILGILFTSLFYIFMITFLFEKKKELHLKDLLKLWKVPILFFILNVVSFFIAEYFILLVFKLRFSDTSILERYSIVAIILKFSLGMLLSSLFLLIDKTTKLPKNTFIYGYLTSLVCLLNIFIFSGYDLSYSILFLEIYILSFFSFQIKKLSLQILFFILNVLLLAFYFYPIFIASNQIITSIFFASNFAAAFFFLPYELMLIRIFLRMKRNKTNIQISRRKITIFMASISAICLLIILFAPLFIQKNKEYLILTINDKTKSAKNYEIIRDLHTIDFFNISSTSKNYLERSICDIKVNPKIKASVISISITNEDSFPVYESNLKFKGDPSGKTVKFLSPINTNNEFSIKFSSAKNANLKIKIIAWYEEYPYNININESQLKNNKLLFKVVKEFALSPKLGDGKWQRKKFFFMLT